VDFACFGLGGASARSPLNVEISAKIPPRDFLVSRSKTVDGATERRGVGITHLCDAFAA
jgi:hypothetical protein